MLSLHRLFPPAFTFLDKHYFCLCMAFQHVGVFYYSCVSSPSRISPSDGDSVISDHSSERESTEENLRAHTTPSDSKQTRKVPINVLNGKWPWQHSYKHRRGGRGKLKLKGEWADKQRATRAGMIWPDWGRGRLWSGGKSQSRERLRKGTASNQAVT